MSYSLKSVNPQTVLSAYTPGSQVNLEIKGDTGALKANSIYLTFKLQVTPATLTSPEVFVDSKVGASSFLENVTTECALFQEVISNYSRMNKMLNCLTLSNDTLTSGIKNTSEMLFGDRSHTNVALRESLTNPYGVCHKPMIGLNNMTGDLDLQKAGGRIKISFKLPSVQKVFYGTAVAGVSYQLSDIEMHYMVVESGSPQVSIRVAEDTQKLIQTTNTTINNTFINPIDSILVSFSTTSSENNANQNSLICQNPNLDKLSWVFADQSNRLVSYEIETPEEQVLSGYSVLNTMGGGFDLRDRLIMNVQDATDDTTDNFLVGLKLGQLLNVSQTGIGLNVKRSGLNEEYYMHMYGYGERRIV